MSLSEIIQEKLRAEGVFAWISNAFWEVLVLGGMSALPTASYLINQGIPPTRLFSVSLWVVNVSMGALITFMAFCMVTSLYYANEYFRGSNRSSSKRSIKNLACDYLFGVMHVAFSAIALIGLAVIASSFNSDTWMALLLWLICVSGPVIIYLSSTRRNAAKRNRRTVSASERGHAVIVLCACSIVSTSGLAPLGGTLLRIVHLGGGATVSFIVEGKSSRNAALILETSDGWFVREDGECEKWSFIAFSNVTKLTWLGKKAQPVCAIESDFVSPAERDRI
jgi:hypothetical protein